MPIELRQMFRTPHTESQVERRVVIVGGGFAGLIAWLVWLVIHLYFLAGFKNRLFVVMSRAWSFFTFRRGSRLIVGKNWRSFDKPRFD